MHSKGIEIKKFIRNYGIPIFIGAVCSALLSATSVYYGIKTNNYLLSFLFCTLVAVGIGIITAKNNKSTLICLVAGTMASGTVFGAITAAVLPAVISRAETSQSFISPIYKLSENMTGTDSYFLNKKVFIDRAKELSETTVKDTVSIGSLVTPLILVAIAVFLVSLTFSFLNRMRYVKRRECDFPEAMAAAAVIQKAENNQNSRKNIFGYRLGLIIGAAVGLVRGIITKIPFLLETKSLNEKNGIDIGVALSPMIGAFGYIAGFRRALSMMIGAFILRVVSVPILTALKICPDASAASTLRNQIGIGLLIGSGIGVLCDFLLVQLEQNERRIVNGEPDLRAPFSQRIAKIVISLAMYFVAFLLLFVSGVGFIFALLTVLLSYISCHAVNVARGESGLFTGIVAIAVSSAIVLSVRGIFNIEIKEAVLCILFIAATCALSSEFMSTYKVATSVGTTHGVILAVNIIGAAVGITVAVISFFSIMKNPAALCENSSSAKLVEFVKSDFSPAAIWISAAITAALTLLKLPAASFALGAFLPFSYSASFFIGGFVRFVQTKKKKKSNFNVAYGLSIGESTAIVLVALAMWIFGV